MSSLVISRSITRAESLWINTSLNKLDFSFVLLTLSAALGLFRVKLWDCDELHNPLPYVHVLQCS